jgi:hypothetical protein
MRAIRQDPAKYGSRLVAKGRAIWYEIFRLVDDGPIGNKNIATELLKITGPNLFGPYLSVSALIIKQFGWLFSA